VYLVLCSAVTLVALGLLPDRQGMDHGLEYDQAETAGAVAERRSRWPLPGRPPLLSGSRGSQPPG